MFKKMLYKYEHVIKIQVHRGERYEEYFKDSFKYKEQRTYLKAKLNNKCRKIVCLNKILEIML